ncbi:MULTISPECIES: hypothetical protein [Nonomuraea]|uniref:Uncharacterized protein n=1 Tax=Nonomuraea mangrovi TaxID=2316207 RepID=A0ABW4T5Y4_9ACTN
MPIIDAWAQHPTQRFLQEDMLEWLPRWGGTSISDQQQPDEAAQDPAR